MKKLAILVCAATCASALLLAGCSISVSVTTSNNAANNASAQPAQNQAPAENDYTAYSVGDADIMVGRSEIVVTMPGKSWIYQISGDNLKEAFEPVVVNDKETIFTIEAVGSGAGTIRINSADESTWLNIDVISALGEITGTTATDNNGAKGESRPL